MTAHPQLATESETIAELADEAGQSHQHAFPVVSSNGELTGLVLDSQVYEVSAVDWSRVRVDQLAMDVPSVYVAAPNDPAGRLVSRTPLGGEVTAVVVADSHVSGIVVTTDLQQALRRRALARPRT